ncbi:hypothetical protein [Burkholderia thailandensis]|uniref:hypothetical protein n=1 Tax=Burkholderia thailandensis TaxID=57975 RepID=UPI0029907FDE|nr:hypothetical protein [Burkholderia thailandensis]
MYYKIAKHKKRLLMAGVSKEMIWACYAVAGRVIVRDRTALIARIVAVNLRTQFDIISIINI